MTAGNRFNTWLLRCTHVLLWSVSAVLTCYFLASIGDGPAVLFMGALGLGFELAKIALWGKAKATEGAARMVLFVIASLFIIFSLFWSAGAALQVVEKARSIDEANTASALRSDAEYQAVEADIRTLDGLIAVQVDRIKTLPADYVSASLRMSDEVETLRAKRSEATAQLQSVASHAVAPARTENRLSFFNSIADKLHVNTESLTLWVLLVAALLLELGAISTDDLRPQRTRVQGGQDRASWEDCEEQDDMSHEPIEKRFFDAMLDGEGRPLRGRALVAQDLGLSERQARTVYEHLIKGGFVRVEQGRAWPARPVEEIQAQLLSS